MFFSVLMSVYAKERPGFLRQALESLSAQTVQAAEIVIVKDGPIGAELESVIDEFAARLPIRLCPLAENVGLGLALRAGVEACTHDLIARMDSDDLSVPERFELQTAYMRAHPECALSGGYIAEFDSDPACGTGVRTVPLEHDAIRRYAGTRNPMNHMTVIFRKAQVLAAGNYQSFHGFEDYHLWVRMLRAGCVTGNIPQVLVLARVGNGMLQRRGGLKYWLNELRLNAFFLKIGHIGPARFLLNAAIRTVARAVPAGLRGALYRNLLRKKPSVPDPRAECHEP